jgi:hypothetical protein
MGEEGDVSTSHRVVIAIAKRVISRPLMSLGALLTILLIGFEVCIQQAVHYLAVLVLEQYENDTRLMLRLQLLLARGLKVSRPQIQSLRLLSIIGYSGISLSPT